MTSRQQSGFTIIELLIAATVGVFLVGGVGAVFVSIQRSSTENELIAGMQDQARFAMATLSRDLAMAGYWGDLPGTDNIVPNFRTSSTLDDSSTATTALTASIDCGTNSGQRWSFETGNPIEFRNHSSGTSISSTWSCLSRQWGNTDAVAIRRVSGRPTAEMTSADVTVALRPYHFYLQTNGTLGTLIRWGASQTASPSESPALPPLTFHRFYPRIYFVRDFALTPGDGIPTLCRRELCPAGWAAGSTPEENTCDGGNSNTGFYSECIAEGVEDFQITWGLDTNGDTRVEQYVAAPSQTQLSVQAQTARIELLMRSRNSTAAYRDQKTYQIGDNSAFTPSTAGTPTGAPADQQTANFYRRVYTTTVRLRNLQIQTALNARVLQAATGTSP